VEKTRHFLLLREKLQEQQKTSELSKLDKEIQNAQAKARNSLFSAGDNCNSATFFDENPKDVDIKEKVKKIELEIKLGIWYKFLCSA
jgi:hypothetical protein